MNWNADAILFDLDGTIWDGNEGAPGALSFLERVRAKGIPHLFLSNNSWQTPAKVAARLNHLSVPATVRQVITAGQAAGPFVTEHLGLQKRLMVLGSDDLCLMLQEAGHRAVPAARAGDCNAVVVGLADWTYADLTAACRALAQGAKLVAVNLDRTMPGEGALPLPKPGAMVAALRAAVPGAPAPLVVGKPSPALFHEALRRLNLPPRRVAVVGDGLETDIAGGKASGLRTVWLHRGRPTKDVQPEADFVVRDLAELAPALA